MTENQSHPPIVWSAIGRGIPRTGDRAQLAALQKAAADCHTEGNYFAAAYALEQAEHCAWGDSPVANSCVQSSIQDYQRCLNTHGKCSLQSLSSIWRAARLYWKLALYSTDGATYQTRGNELLGELGQRLFECFQASSERENYLVRGLIVETDLIGSFEPVFSSFEVDWSSERPGFGKLEQHLPSAFLIFRYLGDYQGAKSVVDLCPDAFTTPGLRGWKAAVRGLLGEGDVATSFREAADAFGEDQPPITHEDMLQRGGEWSSINISLWTPYFRGRSFLASAVQEPDRVPEFVARAADAIPNREDLGWNNPEVARFAFLVKALARLLASDGTIDISEAKAGFLREARFNGEQTGDDLAVRFVQLAADALTGWARDPRAEMVSGHLPKALEVLSRLPLMGPAVANVVGPVLAGRANDLRLGPIRTWMHRTLEGIKDEKQLQRIILRLSEASVRTRYAQVLHGPLEYGKDVVVLLDHDGHRTLRMYQAKVGDFSHAGWRAVKPQLEEMFDVPVSRFLLPAGPEPFREGVLICNGHALPNAQVPMDSWFQVQKDERNRHYEFMHLDDIVRWIEDEHLVNEFRVVLTDLGITVAT